MTLLVTYTTHAGQREMFLQKVLQSGLPELVRQEDGCLRYDYFLSAERPDEILLAEQWASPEQQEIHLRQPHMARLQQLKTTYIAETAVQRL
ncbi:putative quinol monooxygenase [Ruminococcus sp.]